MKRVACLLSFLLVMATSAFGAPYPHVPLVLGYMPFDQSCEQWRHTSIERQWYEELQAKIKMFQDYWDQEAPLLLGTTSRKSTSHFGIKRCSPPSPCAPYNR